MNQFNHHNFRAHLIVNIIITASVFVVVTAEVTSTLPLRRYQQCNRRHDHVIDYHHHHHPLRSTLVIQRADRFLTSESYMGIKRGLPHQR